MDINISSIVANDDFNSHKEGVRQSLWNEWKQINNNEASTTGSRDTRWFERLWELQANDPARHYHTAVHVQELLVYNQLLQPKCLPTMSEEEQRAVILAIFFHDAIYDAKSITNEEDSMKLFQSFETNTLVDEMILASKGHVESGTENSTIAFFLDLDLSVLGKSDVAYQNYAHLIRMEYSYVPHETYCAKRAEILETFLQQDYIYKTPLFREMFEERARLNVAHEIAFLRRGVIYQ